MPREKVIFLKICFAFLFILPQTHSDGMLYDKERMQGLSKEQ